jgi:anti-sigma B factor antagonist
VDESLDPELHITVTREHGVVVVAVRGELDAASTPELQTRLAAEAGGGVPLVLDLVECDFVDSTGLHAIIDARAAVEGAGGQFAVACVPDGPVARVIEVALPGMLETHATRASALAAVG